MHFNESMWEESSTASSVLEGPTDRLANEGRIEGYCWQNAHYRCQYGRKEHQWLSVKWYPERERQQESEIHLNQVQKTALLFS